VKDKVVVSSPPPVGQLSQEAIMSTPASIKKHPIHPMLVTLPIGLWLFSFVSDVAARLGLGSAPWSAVAFYTMAGGIAGALIAAIPGFIDLLSLREPHARRLGFTHMSINLLVVALYCVNLGLRYDRGDAAGLPFGLSIVALLMLVISGWLGGELVYVKGVGVEPAHSHESLHRHV
jgi:uncharacterized membrane protein